jgi:hypothetical protein
MQSCNVNFANEIENTICLNILSRKLNVKKSSKRLKPDSYEMYQRKTDRLTPDSRLQPNAYPPEPTIGETMGWFALLLPESPPS